MNVDFSGEYLDASLLSNIFIILLIDVFAD